MLDSLFYLFNFLLYLLFALQLLLRFFRFRFSLALTQLSEFLFLLHILSLCFFLCLGLRYFLDQFFKLNKTFTPLRRQIQLPHLHIIQSLYHIQYKHCYFVMLLPFPFSPFITIMPDASSCFQNYVYPLIGHMQIYDVCVFYQFRVHFCT